MISVREIKDIILRLFYRLLGENGFLHLRYLVHYHRFPNLSNPKRFSEKMYRLMSYYRNQENNLIALCYDKYMVRNYVYEKLGNHQANNILNDVIGIFDDPASIDFTELPDSFALKLTQSSGYNIICPNKAQLDYDAVKAQLAEWQRLSKKNADCSINDYYYSGKNRILCEALLQRADGSIPPDIRIYCFNGVARLYVCDFGTTEVNGSHGQNIKRNVYDSDWNLLPVDLGRPRDEAIDYRKPDNLDEMRIIAEKLSEDFPFVRVDLYDLDGKIVFGELTWIPMGGNCTINPDKFDFILGEWLSLPRVK